MSSEEPPKKTESAPLWPAVVCFGAILLAVFVSGEFDKESPGTGRMVLGWFFGIGAACLFLWLIWGRSASETASNGYKVFKGAITFIVVSLVLGGLLQCSGIATSTDGRGIGDVPDNVRR